MRALQYYASRGSASCPFAVASFARVRMGELRRDVIVVLSARSARSHCLPAHHYGVLWAHIHTEREIAAVAQRS